MHQYESKQRFVHVLKYSVMHTGVYAVLEMKSRTDISSSVDTLLGGKQKVFNKVISERGDLLRTFFPILRPIEHFQLQPGAEMRKCVSYFHSMPILFII